MPNNREYVQEWYEKGSHDIDAARILIKGGGHSDTIGILLQQAFEKYIKGYLISKGWRLKKTHDLVELLKAAQEYNIAFKDFTKLADRLTSVYLHDKYPPVSPEPKEETASLLTQTEKLISYIKEQT